MNTNLFPTIPGNSIQQYLNYIHSIPVLSINDELILLKKMQEGCNDAAHDIILHHLRFVAFIAHKYKSAIVPIEDLIQEGNVGLLQAVKNFDLTVSKGIRFATFAVYHIKSAVLNFIHHNFKLIDIVKTASQRKIFNNKSMFSSEILDQKEINYIAETLNVEKSDVIDMHQRLNMYCQSVIIDESGVYDIIPIADDRYDPALLLEKFSDEEVQQHMLRNAMLDLSTRDRDILHHRFFSEKKLTQTEVGKLFGISYERVRQIEQKLINKLRNDLYDK